MNRERDATRATARAALGQIHDRSAPIRGAVRRRFTVDTRALAAMRIALGCIILGDLAYRATALEMFYTNDGAYPLSAYEATYTQYNGLSVHALSGELWVQQLLFVIAGLFAVALIVGYRTRLVGLVSALLLFSLHARNPAVLNGGDRLLRVVLFVALVAPLGERWSVDARRRGDARERVASFGTAAVLCQPLVVFTSNAVLKHRGETWYSGDAIEIALHNDTMTIFLGDVVVEYPALMTALNYGWIALLAGSVLFLLVPTGRLRALAVVAYLSAFAGMALTMSVGVFPYTLAASVLPFLTTPFWEWVGRRVPERVRGRTPTAAALGPLGKPPLERRLLERLRERDREDLADFGVAYARSVLTIAGALVLVWMLLFAADNVSGYEVPDEIDYTHLDQQKWGLYAPDPSDSYSWFVPEATLSNGSTAHALNGGPAEYDRPPDAAATYDSFRHRKFLQAVDRAGEGQTNGVIARAYASWACRQANGVHDGRVERVTLYQMYQPSPVGGEYEHSPTKIIVVDWDCRADTAYDR